jgi:hypothetical protein
MPFINLVYCNKSAELMVFSKCHSNHAIWHTIVELISGKLRFLEENEGRIQTPLLRHAPLHVDVQKLKMVLNEIV